MFGLLNLQHKTIFPAECVCVFVRVTTIINGEICSQNMPIFPTVASWNILCTVVFHIRNIRCCFTKNHSFVSFKYLFKCQNMPQVPYFSFAVIITFKKCLLLGSLADSTTFFLKKRGMLNILTYFVAMQNGGVYMFLYTHFQKFNNWKAIIVIMLIFKNFGLYSRYLKIYKIFQIRHIFWIIECIGHKYIMYYIHVEGLSPTSSSY